MKKVVLALIPILGVLFALTACSSDSTSTATEEVTVIAVDAAGAPIDGWTVSPDVPGQVACSAGAPSPSTLTAGVYSCPPNAEQASVCWKGTDERTLLCAVDPWDRTLHTKTSDVDLPQISTPSNPVPWALETEDGTRCVLRQGGGWGVGADDMTPVYGCLGDGDLAVLQGAGDDSAIDRSSDAWTVKIGPMGSADADLPKPTVQVVQTAYFAGAEQG